MKFLGLRTLIYPTSDIAASKKWWQDFLGVDSIAAGLARAGAHGCTVVSGMEDVGGGISITHLMSPTGDRFGLILNPHFKVDSN